MYQSRGSLSSLRLYKRTSPGPWQMYAFRNKASFYNTNLLAHRSSPKLEDHPLLADRDCLLNIFAATLHIGGVSSFRNLTAWHVLVTVTHLSWDIVLYRAKNVGFNKWC